VVEPLQVLNLLLSFPFFFSMVIKKLLYQASKTKGVLKLMKNDIVAKIDFYQALPIIDKDGADEQREFRKVSHRLVLPVTGLAEIREILDKQIIN
jgi:hypothetical protein